MSVPYHAWTHRPRSQGGTDPIEFPAVSPAPWIRFFLGDADQTITAAGREIVQWDNIVNDYTEVFEPTGISGGSDLLGVNLLEDGLYAVTVRLNLASVPSNTGIVTEMWHIDVDGFTAYQRYHNTTDPYSENSVHDSYIFRNGPTEGDTELHVFASNPSGADASLVLSSFGWFTGTYMEIVKLAPATVAYPS